jgi:hypothetical protein
MATKHFLKSFDYCSTNSGPAPESLNHRLAGSVPEFIDPRFRENKPKTLVFT